MAKVKSTTDACDPYADSERCVKDQETVPCSGKGRCNCGVCECSTPSYGEFCQCDDTACPR